MNILLSTIGRRGYLVDYFRFPDGPAVTVHGTTDRHDSQRGFSPGLLACDRRHVVPSIASPDYVGEVLGICERERIGLITSLYDDDCLRLSGILDELRAAGVFPVISSPRVNEICYDKLQTHQFLVEHGFPAVPTWPSPEACLQDGAPAPVFVKPRFGFGSRDSLRVDSLDTLRTLGSRSHSLVVQSFVDGPEYGMDLFCQDGAVVSCVVRRKISMRAGETDQAVTILDRDLIDFGVRLGEALCPTGPLDVDFFLTPQGPMVIDLNPRLGGGYPLTHAAGGDYPALMLRMARGETLPSAVGTYPAGLVMIKDIRTTVTTTDALSHLVSSTMWSSPGVEDPPFDQKTT